MIASHTKLECAQCLFRYKCKYIDKLPEVPSRPLAVGQAVHDFADRYAKHCISQGLQTDVTEVPRLIQEAVREAQIPGIYYEVADIAERFSQYEIFNPDTFVGSEEHLPGGWDAAQKKWPKQPNVGKHIFIGVLDRLEAEGDTLIIHDYKTDHRVRSLSEVENDEQLRRYVFLASQEYPGYDKYKVRLDFVRHGFVLEVDFDASVADQARDELATTLDWLESVTEYPAIPGEHCGLCGYSHLCPLAKAAGPSPVVTSAEQALAAAQELLAIEKRHKDLQTALKTWAAQAGPIEVNGTGYGFSTHTSRTIKDLRGFSETVEVLGQDPWQWLSWNGRKRLPSEVYDAVKDLFVPTARSTFGKMKGEDEAEESA